MNKKITLGLLAAVCFTAGFTSCKKSSSHNTTCRIATITSAGSGTPIVYTLTYGNDGKISTIISNSANTQKVFTYSGTTVYINTADTTGTVTERDTLQLNGQGLVTSLFQYSPGSMYFSHQTMTYDGSGELSSVTNVPSTGSTTVTSYQFTDGDMIKSIENTNITTYTYYTDKSFQDGDYFKTLQLFQYGNYFLENKHLLKSETDYSGDVTNFNYTFDNGNKITQLTLTEGSTVQTLSYTYDCQ